jgi:hypothetical protein
MMCERTGFSTMVIPVYEGARSGIQVRRSVTLYRSGRWKSKWAILKRKWCGEKERETVRVYGSEWERITNNGEGKSLSPSA